MTQKGWCLPGSLAPVRFCDQISMPCDVHRPPGKTTFLKFALTWLLSKNQVVLLRDDRGVWLFYQDNVFSQPAKSGFKYLPQKPGYCPMWALIDVNDQDSGIAFHLGSNIWPIHVSPPDPIRWRSWHKQSKTALWGMPLWEIEELVEGYVLS